MINTRFSAKFNKITRFFNFSGVVDKSDLPAYVRQYIKKEQILTIYKTSRDYGVFTDKKIVLFDNKGKTKQIYTIPYKSISNPSICFNEDSAELNLLLDSGFPVSLKFVNMTGNDKLRLRVLYICMDKLVNDQEPVAEDMKNLITDNLRLDK